MSSVRAGVVAAASNLQFDDDLAVAAVGFPRLKSRGHRGSQNGENIKLIFVASGRSGHNLV